MKIRNGFVSNSSTSSFICLMDEKLHENILSQINVKSIYADSPQEVEWAKKFLNAMIKKHDKFNCKLVSFQQISGEMCEPEPEDAFRCVFSKNEIKIITKTIGSKEATIHDLFYCWMNFYKDSIRKLAKSNPSLVYTDEDHF